MPHFWCGLAEVWELILLVRLAPDGLCVDVEVAAEQEVELPSPQHEVKGKVGCGSKVGINGGEKGKVIGMIPLLPRGGGGTAVVAAGNGAAYGHVAGRKKVEFGSQGEGGDGGPDAAVDDSGSIVGKDLFNMPGKRKIAGGAMARQDTTGTGVGGKGCRLKGLESQAEPPFGGVAQAAGRLQQSVGWGRVAACMLGDGPVGRVNCGEARVWGVLHGRAEEAVVKDAGRASP